MAGAGYTVEISGDKEVVAAFKRLQRKSSDLSGVFGVIAAEAAADARALAPTITGRLAGTIRPGKGRAWATISAGSGAVPYAGSQEYGWPGRYGAQPYLRPAADSKADSSAEAIAREIQKFIDSVGLG